MAILIDIGHPAHVHLFRNYIVNLQNTKQKFIVVSRDKEITNQLLDYYKIPHISISKQAKGLFAMLIELLIRDFKIFKLHNKHKFKTAIGTSVSIGHLTFFSFGKVKSYNFNEDDDNFVPLYAKISYPFNTKIVIPNGVEYKKWGSKRVLYNSYHELAYLHPSNFKPDEKILAKYGLVKNEYIIARFSSLEAHHDVGIKGISKKLWLDIKKELGETSIIESIEGKKTHQIDIWDMHHVLKFAKMLITDSQTMTMEASLLGVPSVRINSFAKQIGVLKDLEFNFELTKSFFPKEKSKILSYIKTMIHDNNLRELFQKRLDILLQSKIDFNEWMIDYFEKENLKFNLCQT